MQYVYNDPNMYQSSPVQYARGGHVSLRDAVDMIRSKGEEGDTVLAHINPMEAAFLDKHFGGDVNPNTGLPQYGRFWKKLMHIAMPVTYFGSKEGSHSPLMRKVAPVIGAVAGGMMGGPMGATLGGAIGGAAIGGRRHMLDHALGGALVGAGHAALSPMIGGSLGLDPSSMGGQMMMTGHTGLGSSLGLGSIFGGASGAASGMGGGAAGGMGAGAGAGAAGAGAGMGGLLNTALLGTAIAGNLFGKAKMPKPGQPGYEEPINEHIGKHKVQWGPEHAFKPRELGDYKAKHPPRGYRGTNWNFFPSPEEQEEQLARVNQEMAQPFRGGYAKGGQVKGYYEGGAGGQDDTIPTTLPEGSYIMDATTVSLIGDGNSKNGAHKIKKFIDRFEKSGITRNLGTSRNIKAMVSDGEQYLSPEEVAAVGRGSIRNGSKTLDKFRKNIRKHKGVKKFLPPKSKELTHYLR